MFLMLVNFARAQSPSAPISVAKGNKVALR